VTRGQCHDFLNFAETIGKNKIWRFWLKILSTILWQKFIIKLFLKEKQQFFAENQTLAAELL
jgi:hypothetical protein